MLRRILMIHSFKVKLVKFPVPTREWQRGSCVTGKSTILVQPNNFLENSLITLFKILSQSNYITQKHISILRNFHKYLNLIIIKKQF